MIKLSVKSVVILIVLSLIGLVVVQTWLLSYAFEQKEAAFDRNARAALGAASRQLELGEVKIMISARLGAGSGIDSLVWTEQGIDAVAADGHNPDGAHYIRAWANGDFEDTSDTDRIVNVVRNSDSIEVLIIDQSSSDQENSIEALEETHRRLIRDSSQATAGGTYSIDEDSTSFVFQIAIDSGSLHGNQMDRYNMRTLMVRSFVDQLAQGESAPITERIDSLVADSVVRQSLIRAGINLHCETGIHSIAADSMVYASDQSVLPQLRESSIRARLLMSDLFASGHDLTAFFPNRTMYIWKQIGPQVAASVFLMIIIVSVFAYSARTIVKQKQFATRLTDFINNMTHEFKTPISTVALASEAIGRADVAADAARVSRYNEMIRNETVRMRKQTDKILQMAILEEGDYELKLEDVDLHNVIQSAVASIALHVESNGGALLCELNAKEPVVRADNVHVANIINNLLDNAVKYSPEAPNVRIRTMNTDSGITIEVADRGLGIAPQDLKQVWQKYYRVSSGNRHDVKGFGLGLSYVRLMTEAHDGQVSLVSHFGEGTTVSIYLPKAGPKDSGGQK